MNAVDYPAYADDEFWSHAGLPMVDPAPLQPLRPAPARVAVKPAEPPRMSAQEAVTRVVALLGLVVIAVGLGYLIAAGFASVAP